MAGLQRTGLGRGVCFHSPQSSLEKELPTLLWPAEELTSRARLLAGRALAHEGLANWRAALTDYSDALELAAQGG